MKVSKRTWMGISAVAGAVLLGSGIVYWLPGEDAATTAAAADDETAEEDQQPAQPPTPLSSDQLGDTSAAPTPDTRELVVRGNDQSVTDSSPEYEVGEYQSGDYKPGSYASAAISDEPQARYTAGETTAAPPAPPSNFAAAYQSDSPASDAETTGSYEPREFDDGDFVGDAGNAGLANTETPAAAADYPDPPPYRYPDETAATPQYLDNPPQAEMPAENGYAGPVSEYRSSDAELAPAPGPATQDPYASGPTQQDPYAAAPSPDYEPATAAVAGMSGDAEPMRATPLSQPELTGGPPTVSDQPAQRPTWPSAQAAAQPVQHSLSGDERYASPQPSPSENRAGSIPADHPLLAQASPGSPQLEGVQAPSLAVEKTGPEEVRINIPATYTTTVRNLGRSAAHQVLLTDRIPKGTELRRTTPVAHREQDLLIWRFDRLDPDQEQTVTMEVVPVEEGEIGSVAQVTFHTQASVRSMSTRPQLVVKHQSPERVLIGDDVVFSITVSNPGTGPATGVVIEEDVPVGLDHPAGKLLESEIGTLEPGESKQLELVVKAAAAGAVRNTVRVKGDGELVAEDHSEIRVVAPQLEIGLEGPTRRFTGRKATYSVLFQNGGTAPATNVELTAFLPKGLEFAGADNKGQYDARSHAVFWSLRELPDGELGRVQIEVIPIDTGDQIVRAEARADLGLVAEEEHATRVESVTELEFTVADLHDPIEVGSETTYEIRILNNGEKPATDVQVAAVLPAGLEFVTGDGHTKITLQDQQGQQMLMMAPIEKLNPRAEATYRVTVLGRTAEDHLFTVQLSSRETSKPVRKQEGTTVYRDGQ